MNHPPFQWWFGKDEKPNCTLETHYSLVTFHFRVMISTFYWSSYIWIECISLLFGCFDNKLIGFFSLYQRFCFRCYCWKRNVNKKMWTKSFKYYLIEKYDKKKKMKLFKHHFHPHPSPSFSNCYIIVHQFSTHAHFVSIKTNSIAQDHW